MPIRNNTSDNLDVITTKDTSIFNVINDYDSHLSKQLQSGLKSPKTIKRYRDFLNDFRNFLKANFDQLALGELNESILLDYFSTRTGRKSRSLAPTTQNNYAAVIKAMMKHALPYSSEINDFSIKLTRNEQPQPPQYLQDHQLETLLSIAKEQTHSYRCQAILSFLMATGCRTGELSNMKVNDFNVEDNVICIQHNNKKEKRYIPIPSEIKNIILEYLKLTGVTEWNRNLEGYLFSKDYGTNRQKQFAPRSIQHMCKTIFDKAGFTNLTARSFRHSFAVRSLKTGIPIEHLSQIMGHSNIHTTFNYLQLIPRDVNYAGDL